MVTEQDYQRAIELIEKSESVLVVTHSRPDGDACGCMVAMSEVLSGLGKDVKSLMFSEVPGWYEFLFDEAVPLLGRDVSKEELESGVFFEPDLIVILDTNSYSQLRGFEDYLKAYKGSVLVIDHHATADGLGEVELVDTSAAAASLVVVDLLRFAGWEITKKIAEVLFVGVATDTGWFRFRNADSRVFRECGELIGMGLNPTDIYDHIYQNFTPGRFRLLAAMLSSLELHFEGRYASQRILQKDFEETGAVFSDTEDLINECWKISTLDVAALFVCLKDGEVKVSLRSRGDLDVRSIAQKLGGGGHLNAAGINIHEQISKVEQIILNEVGMLLSKKGD